MDIETLNSLYSHAGWVTFTHKENGFPLALITTPDATAVITLYGAHLLSYRPHTDGRDVLFLSEKAIFQEGTPIRGGVPICWPWFGSRDHSPDHGVARSRMWSVIDSELLENDECALTFELTDTPQTYALWAHRFTLTLRVTVGKKLTMELTTHNDDTVPFTITQALHTYFSLHDITQTTIRGLEGCVYSDKTDHGAEKETMTLSPLRGKWIGCITMMGERSVLRRKRAPSTLPQKGLKQRSYGIHGFVCVRKKPI
jgi:glucose-6-phosphate 1-epimerase